MPIISFESLDMVPEGLKPHAKDDTTTGKVVVNVVPEAKLSEFRDKNISLSKEAEDLTAKYSRLHQIVGDDADAFLSDVESMRQTVQRVKDGDLREGRAIEEAIAKRTDEMRRGYQDQLATESREKNAWKQRAESENGRYKEQVIVSAVKDACMDGEMGILSSAVEDITERAKRVFRVTDDGRLNAYNGDAMIYGGDGTSSVTPKEWVAKLKEEKPYYFKQSHGGGAGSEAGGAGKTKQIAGKFSPEQWSKMSARDRLAAANKEPGASF